MFRVVISVDKWFQFSFEDVFRYDPVMGMVGCFKSLAVMNDEITLLYERINSLEIYLCSRNMREILSNDSGYSVPLVYPFFRRDLPAFIGTPY